MKKAGSKSHHIHDLFGINLEQTKNRKDLPESERDRQTGTSFLFFHHNAVLLPAFLFLTATISFVRTLTYLHMIIFTLNRWLKCLFGF